MGARIAHARSKAHALFSIMQPWPSHHLHRTGPPAASSGTPLSSCGPGRGASTVAARHTLVSQMYAELVPLVKAALAQASRGRRAHGRHQRRGRDYEGKRRAGGVGDWCCRVAAHTQRTSGAPRAAAVQGERGCGQRRNATHHSGCCVYRRPYSCSSLLPSPSSSLVRSPSALDKTRQQG